MRATLIKAFGEPTEVLELSDVPEPSVPAAGEVLSRCRVRANQYERPIRDSGRISGSTFAADIPDGHRGHFAPKIRFAPDFPPEEAVRSELVSGRPKFPVSRENTGNFRYYVASATTTA